MFRTYESIIYLLHVKNTNSTPLQCDTPCYGDGAFFTHFGLVCHQRWCQAFQVSSLGGDDDWCPIPLNALAPSNNLGMDIESGSF